MYNDALYTCISDFEMGGFNLHFLCIFEEISRTIYLYARKFVILLFEKTKANLQNVYLPFLRNICLPLRSPSRQSTMIKVRWITLMMNIKFLLPTFLSI